MIRLLFVDDEERVLDGLKRSMHSMRHEWSMRFAPSGPEALLQLAIEPADVVISDMRMPSMDGAQLLAEVKRLYPQAIRFILSGQSESESIIRATRSAHRYLSKPCDAQTLKAAIGRASSLKTLLNNDALAAMVGSVDTLPTPPMTYMQLRDLLRSPEAAVTEVVDVLQKDIGLTAKVVKLANSGFFGSRQPVLSIERAVSIVGTDAISALVLGKELYDTHASVKSGFSLEKLGQHSFEVAAWARAVALHEGLPRADAERAFLAGVLHDIGRLIFAMSNASQNLARSAERADDKDPLQSVSHHAAAAAYLLGLWAFPESIVEAVLWHHSPTQSGESELGLAGLVHIGDLLAHEQDPGSQGPRGADSEYLQTLGIAERWPAWVALRPKTSDVAAND